MRMGHRDSCLIGAITVIGWVGSFNQNGEPKGMVTTVSAEIDELSYFSIGKVSVCIPESEVKGAWNCFLHGDRAFIHRPKADRLLDHFVEYCCLELGQEALKWPMMPQLKHKSGRRSYLIVTQWIDSSYFFQWKPITKGLLRGMLTCMRRISDGPTASEASPKFRKPLVKLPMDRAFWRDQTFGGSPMTWIQRGEVSKVSLSKERSTGQSQTTRR